MLSKDEILDLRKPKVQPLTLPGGGEVFLRVMTGVDRDSFEAGNYREVGGKVKFDLSNARARLAVRVLCDAAGKRLFGDADAGQVGQIDAVTLDAIYTAARTLNRMGAKEEEEDRKLFGPAQSEGSGSDSPASSDAA